jgi:hypothetical protein
VPPSTRLDVDDDLNLVLTLEGRARR